MASDMASDTTQRQDPVAYPLVSILYCVKCNWLLRASWYQQELLQTFTSKATSAAEAVVHSIVLRPSFVPGTFQVLVKRSADAEWVLVWDRLRDGGFPEAKALKQCIRDVVSPERSLGHSDKKSSGTLLTGSKASSASSPAPPPASGAVSSTGSIPLATPREHTPTEREIETYGSPKLASSHKTFCEECVENLPPAWEM